MSANRRIRNLRLDSVWETSGDVSYGDGKRRLGIEAKTGALIPQGGVQLNIGIQRGVEERGK